MYLSHRLVAIKKSPRETSQNEIVHLIAQQHTMKMIAKDTPFVAQHDLALHPLGFDFIYTYQLYIIYRTRKYIAYRYNTHIHHTRTLAYICIYISYLLYEIPAAGPILMMKKMEHQQGQLSTLLMLNYHAVSVIHIEWLSEVHKRSPHQCRGEPRHPT